MVRRHAVAVTTAALVLAVALPLSAQDATLEDIAKRSLEIRDQAAEIVGHDTINQLQEVQRTAAETYKDDITPITAQNPEIFRRGVELAEEMAGSHMDAARADGSLPASGGTPGANGDPNLRYRIFVSQKMPRGEVKRLIDTYADRPDVTLVVRGVLPGQKVGDLYKWIGGIVGKMEKDRRLANFTIDPEPYAALGTDQVPVVARYDDQGNLMAFVLGTTSTTWLDERVTRGATGNLGALGPTIKVGEEDMITAMKRQAAAYDWKGAAKGAISRYWSNTPSHDLPVAQRVRLRELDPTFEVSRTITAQNGQVIARAGERINPLQYMPFNQTLIVINPADPKQMEWARAQLAARRGQRVTLLATQMRTFPDMESMAKAANKLGTRMFLMQPAVKEKFQIEAVPSLVYQDGLKFLIEEQLPSSRPGAR